MAYQDSLGRDDCAKAEYDLRPMLLCFSHLRWNFVYQRPQHLLSRAAASYQVLFFEEPIYRDSDQPKLEFSQQNGVTVAVPILPPGTNEADSIRAQRELIDDLLSELDQSQLVVWYYTPSAMDFGGHLTPKLCIYDNMDELSAFLGASDRLIQLERRLFERADIVFTGGKSLFDAKRGRHSNIHAFPSSIDYKHFAAARHLKKEPESQVDIPHPRLGFFGVIDERMNLDLVRDIADARPDWHLVMVGPVVKISPESLPRRANIHWLGAQSYNKLPEFLAGWDVGMMPFAINESTRFISPTKTPEFLAAGIRVVSTPIADVVRPYGELGMVEIASDAGSFIEKIASLLSHANADWQKGVDQYLSQMSWDKTWGEMQALMRDAVRRKSSRRNVVATPMMEVASV